MNIRKFIVSIAGILALTGVVFLPSLRNGFVSLDDPVLVTENASILSPAAAVRSFTSFHRGMYHPLVQVSYAVEYALFGMDPAAFHATNLVFHLLNTLLVFVVILLAADDAVLAGIASLLFGIHPLHVESVAWISERKDVLYAFFFLASLASYLRYLRDGKTGRYLLSLALFLFSLLSKPMAVSLPLLLLSADYLRGRRGLKRLVVEKLPFVGLAALFSVVALYAGRSGPPAAAPVPPAAGVLAAAFNLLFYIGKLAVPVRLSVLYPYTPARIAALPGVLPLVGAGTAAFAAALAYAVRRRARIEAFGLFWYAAAVLPVLQLAPVGLGIPADRYTYLPAVGLFVAAGSLALRLYRSPAAPRAFRAALPVLCAGALLWLGLQSRARCGVWKDSLALYDDVLAKYPDSAIALNNRGNEYFQRGEYDRALADYMSATELDPSYAAPRDGRAAVMIARGEYGRAREALEAQLARNPRRVTARLNRGNIRLRTGDAAGALEDYRAILSVDPRDSRALYSIGNVHFHRREYDRAVEAFDRALAVDPANVGAWKRKGESLAALGRMEEALRALDRAAGVAPRDTEVLHARGTVRSSLGDHDGAVADFSAAVEQGGGSVLVLVDRAAALMRAGRFSAAAEDFSRVLAADPDNGDALFNRGNCRAALGEYRAAVDDYTAFLRHDPDDPGALERRAAARMLAGDADRARRDIDRLKALGRPVDEAFFVRLAERARR